MARDIEKCFPTRGSLSMVTADEASAVKRAKGRIVKWLTISPFLQQHVTDQGGPGQALLGVEQVHAPDHQRFADPDEV